MAWLQVSPLARWPVGRVPVIDTATKYIIRCHSGERQNQAGQLRPDQVRHETFVYLIAD
jgi:hypothetical protein